jgi:hypothetical protein
MPARRRRAFGPRRARRRLIWAEFDAVVTQTATPQFINLDLLQTYKAVVSSTIAKCTVVRTHGYVAVISGASPGSRFWIGLSVMDLNDITGAMAAPNAAVVNPRDNPYARWAHFSRHSFDQATAVIPSGIGMSGDGNDGVLFDLKSKRRLDNLTETWGLSILGDTGMAATSSYHVFFRTLLALP